MYLIAEIGNNHDGLFERARRLIKLAAESGADAAKFQIFRAERLVHPSLPSRIPGHKTQLERMKSLEFTKTQWDELYWETLDEGLDFLASCFDLETLDEWAPRLPAIKIASGDLTYTQMIRQAVSYGKPIYLSTGCAQDHEINNAVQWIPKKLLTLMHCVSKYPCLNPGLEKINALRAKGYTVGYSCHTPGIEAAYTAACMGVTTIEKHFTDESRTMGDHSHSATPQELYSLRGRLDQLQRLMKYQDYKYDISLQRGPYATKDLEKGQTLTNEDYLCLRPGFGRSCDITGHKLRHSFRELEAIDG